MEISPFLLMIWKDQHVDLDHQPVGTIDERTDRSVDRDLTSAPYPGP